MEQIVYSGGRRYLLEEEESDQQQQEQQDTNLLLDDIATTTTATMSHEETKTTFAAVAFVLYTLAALFSIGSTIFVCYYRKNPIISLSQPRYLGLMFTGATFVAFSGYFLIAAEINEHRRSDEFLNRMCNFWLWWFIIGHTVVYMALFGKLWRIKKVTRLRRGQNVQVRQTIWPLRVMCLLNIAILTAWRFVDPPKYVRLENEEDNTTMGTCDFTQFEFFIPLQLAILFSASLGIWMTYQTRNLPHELTEGARIFHIYVSNFVTFVVCGSLYWIGRSLPNLAMMNIAVLFATFFTSTTSVVPIIVPKMYYIWYEHKHGHLPEGVQTIGTGQTHIAVGTTTQFSSGRHAQHGSRSGRTTIALSPPEIRTERASISVSVSVAAIVLEESKELELPEEMISTEIMEEPTIIEQEQDA